MSLKSKSYFNFISRNHLKLKNKKYSSPYKKRIGSVSISAIMVFTLLSISCLAIEERISCYVESENIDIKAENLLRKAEGTTIIAKEKIVEATQRLYDISSDRSDFKARIESYTYRKQYVSEIENLTDVNMDNVKIDLERDDIAEDGSGLYKFWVNITAMDPRYDMKRTIKLCVTMKNLMKDKPIKEEDNKQEENKPNNQNEQVEEIPEVYNARDALIFRVAKE